MIAIKNMSMPKSCEDCRCTFDGFDGSTCCILGAKRIDWTKRPEDCPLVEPERPQGEWIVVDRTSECNLCGCWFCNEELNNGEANFCPNCGASMKGGAEND